VSRRPVDIPASYVMVVNPSLPAKTVSEFIAYAKANPGKVNMGSQGVGSIGHLAGETRRLFPQYLTWLNQRFDSQWETAEVTSDIKDFGAVDWKDRPLDGVMVKTMVKQRNRILGGCIGCHGVDAKGSGVHTPRLKNNPPDLTVLAKANGGLFSIEKIYEVIDGRAQLQAHGTRDMPIWGKDFTTPEMISLMDYLYRIQQK
jgi:mono/diheme cytochrome c family protein